MAKTGVVQRKTGNDLVSFLSRTLVKDVYTAIAELVTNSYDADAEKVEIDVDLLEGRLVIRDNGTGMDERGIEGFYMLGDSPKLEERITPKGRVPIGKFGLATIVVPYLCNSYTLETRRNGRQITATENFNTPKRGEGPKINITKCSKDEHGTAIEMHDLKFDSSSLNPERLKQILEWGLPCVPDFDIYVNKVLLPKRTMVRNCTEYVIEQYVKGVGSVHGSIFYNARGALKLAGIQIYVNGRAVGDPRHFLRDLSGTMLHRLVGVVNADGLENLIRLDRSKFDETSQKFVAVKDAIMRVVHSIQNDVMVSPSRFSLYRGRMKDNIIFEVLKSAEAKLNERLLSASKETPYRLELTIDEHKKWISRYDPKKGVIYINGANNLLSSGDRQNPINLREWLEPSFIMLALNAIADHNIAKLPNSGNVVKELAANTFNAFEQLFRGLHPLKPAIRELLSSREEHIVNPNNLLLNPYRLYTAREISDLSGHDFNTVRYLYISGVLKSYREDPEVSFRADSIMQCLRQIEGYVPVGKILRRNEYMKPFKIAGSPERVYLLDERKVNSRSGKPEYLVNVGVDEPFMFVRQDRIRDFKNWYSGSKK